MWVIEHTATKQIAIVAAGDALKRRILAELGYVIIKETR